MKKRILSLLLAVCMAATLLPVTALAVDGEGTAAATVTVQIGNGQVNTVASFADAVKTANEDTSENPIIIQIGAGTVTATPTSSSALSATM